MTGMHATITKTKCSSCYIDSESDVTVMLIPMTSQISVGRNHASESLLGTLMSQGGKRVWGK